MSHLTSLRLAGWKSIRDAEIEIRPLNVLIGANGAGKSNLVGFFKVVNEMVGGRFQVHVGNVKKQKTAPGAFSRSCQHISNHVAGDVGQAEVAAVEAVR